MAGRIGDQNYDVLAMLGITDIDGSVPAVSSNKWTTARTLSFTGDATGSGSVDGSVDVATALTLANTAVTPAIYGDATHVVIINVDAKGRIIAAAPQAIAFPVPAVTFGTGAPSGTPATGALYFDTTLATYVGYVGRGGAWNQIA